MTDVRLHATIRMNGESGRNLLISADDKEPVAVIRPVSRGKLMLLSCGDLYSNSSLGKTSTVPNSRQAWYLQSALNLMGELVEVQYDADALKTPWEQLLNEYAASNNMDSITPNSPPNQE